MYNTTDIGVAQVCLNGHIINSYYRLESYNNKNFCSDCGEETINNCPKCNESIQGGIVIDGMAGMGGLSSPPSYCHNCGESYPWTKNRLEVAKQLALESDIEEEEKKLLIDSLPDLIADSPQATLASTRWKKALSKLGDHTILAFREIFIDVVSETAKKILFP